MRKQKIIFQIIIVITLSLSFCGTNLVLTVNNSCVSLVSSKNCYYSTLHHNSTNTSPYETISKGYTGIIEYDLHIKTEKLGAHNLNSEKQSFQVTIEPFRGVTDDNYIQNSSLLRTSYVFPPDDREKISDTSSYPWRTICKLFITAQDGTPFIGSGFIIDEFHILTCGHCIYIHENGGWVSEVEVIPGMDGTYEPFGHAYATNFRTYTGWTDNEMEEHDWALVTLDKNIGALTGWMGIRTVSYTDSIYTGTLNMAGYPNDLDNGYNMYYDSDNGVYADEYNHWYWMDTAAGQSGSPVWYYDGESRYVLSIFAYEYEDGSYANFGTRINSNKLNDIDSWLDEDSGSSPIDKADLLDAGYYSNISTLSVIAGETNFEIICDVKNEGTVTAPSFKVNYYASENLLIDSSDYLIGSTTLYNLQPSYYKSADWSGIFPSDIPSGQYYVGWIIDAENDIDELNEHNNIVTDNSFFINVETKETGYLMQFIFIPIIIAIGTISVVVAISIILIRKKRSGLEISIPPEKDIDHLKSGSNSLQNSRETPNPQETLMFCPNCGYEITSLTQRFCTNCGNELDDTL